MVGIVFLWLTLVDCSPLLNEVIADIRKGLHKKQTACITAQAKRLIGTRESGGNNRGPRVDSIIRFAGGKPGQAWCSYTMIYLWKKCGVPHEGVGGMAMSWAKASKAIPRERASVTDIFTVFNKYLGRVGHVGMVYEVYPEEPFFKSFEGNINSRGDRESNRSMAGCLIREYSVANGFYRWIK
jgi:hypothetical protein